MVKNYNWILSEEEKNRILNLHENATKRHYINEVGETKPDPKSLTVNLNANWGDGMWRLTAEQKTNISNDLKQIASFIIQNKTKTVSVKIVAGESRVTNFDREPRVDPKTNKTITTSQKVEPGIIATNRSNELNNYLRDYLVNQLKLTNVEFEKPETVIGETPYDPKNSAGSKTKYAREYAAERFVRAVITIKGGEDECLTNMQVMIKYDKSWCKMGVDESRCHKCDESVFSIFVNGMPLNNNAGSNIANLNNSSDGGSRQWVGIFTSDIINNLKSNNTKELVFTYACAYNGGQGCHSDAMHVTITNGKKELVFNDFVSGGVRLKPGDGQRLLLKTDLCGKVIEVGKRLGPNDGPKRTVQSWSSLNRMQGYKVVYDAIDPNTKLIDPKKIYDPVVDAALIRQWEKNPRTWEQFKKQYSITPEMEKKIIGG
jgi:hypothetical protein